MELYQNVFISVLFLLRLCRNCTAQAYFAAQKPILRLCREAKTEKDAFCKNPNILL
jgi:hypothetical protein